MGLALLLGGVVIANRAVAQPPPGPGTNFRVCTRLGTPGTLGQAVICGHRQMFRSSAGNGGSDTAIWDNAATVTYRRAWESFWYLDTSNYAVWIDESSLSGSTYSGWLETNEVFHRANTLVGNVFGQMTPYHVWPSDCRNHTDIYVEGPTTMSPRSSGQVLTLSLAYASSCVVPIGSGVMGGQAESNVASHEIAHVYGYDHFSSWITRMNVGQIHTFSCELGTADVTGAGQWMSVDPYMTQCHDLVYGIGVPSDRDISITPVTQPDGCNLATTPCATIAGSGPSSPVTLTGTSTIRQFRYTTFMNRGGIGAEGVFVSTFLSTDRTVSAGDVMIDQYFNTTDWQPGSTIRVVRNVTFNPQTALPLAGTNYFVLVQVDSDNYFAETRETNNVTDLGVVFRR